MAELSGFFTTSGSPSGDQQASYTQAQLAIAHKIIAACSGYQGVAPGFLNELACTGAGANTVAVATGGAMVDGLFFLNDASQNMNIPSAVGGGNTRIDRIVLRADWAGFNVSVHRIAGTDAASPTAPAITQTSGTTYDIMLCQVAVDTAGVVLVTDERVFAQHIRDGAVTAAKIANRTRKLFIPAASATGSPLVGATGTILTADATEGSYGALVIPSDFVSDMTVKAVVVGGATGNAVLNHSAVYGAAGQAYNTHTDTLAVQVVALTVNLLTEVLTLTLSAEAAGDFIHLTLARSGTHPSDTLAGSVSHLGWLIEYTADS